MEKKAANLLMDFGSVDQVLQEYLMDMALLLMRKLPSDLQKGAKVESVTNQGVSLEGPSYQIVFRFNHDRTEVSALVDIESSFHSQRAARNLEGVSYFKIETDDSGIKLISQILSHFGSF